MEINNCNCGGNGKVFVHTLPTTGREVYYYIYIVINAELGRLLLNQ